MEFETVGDGAQVVNTIDEWSTVDDYERGADFGVVYLNIRSINKHFDEFYCSIQNSLPKIDILILSEINLKECDYIGYEHMYDIQGYIKIYKGRKDKKGGGLMIYIREEFNYEIFNVETFYCESVLFSVKCNTNIEIRLLALYRPPASNVNLFINELEKTLGIFNSDKFVIIGDVNIDVLRNSSVSLDYLNVLCSAGFEQKIDTPTREEFRDGTLVSSCIDHIFTRFQKFTVKSAVVTSKISDHYMIVLGAHLGKNLENNIKNIGVARKNLTLFSRIIYEKLNAVLLPDFVFVSDLYEYMVASYDSAMKESSVQSRSTSRRRPARPWLTQEILNKIKARDNIFRRWKSTRNAIVKNEIRLEYNKIRNIINRAIQSSKKQYFAKLFVQFQYNMKKTWRTINQAMGRSVGESMDGRLVRYMKDTPLNIGNKFMDTIVVNSAINVSCCKQMLFSNYLAGNGISAERAERSMYLPDIHISEIEKLVRSIKKKSAGIDNINIEDITNNLQIFGPWMCSLINMSINECCVPQHLKTAVVRPVYKNGQFSDYNNYRPIAILPCMDKIIERYIGDKIVKYLNKFDLLDDNQYGFRMKRSTTTLLEKFTDLINSSLGKNMHVLCCFVDFSKAFDSINHSVLVKCLDVVGIRGGLARWIEEYLKNRLVMVRIGDIFSKKAETTCGVPQGSILGPLLYLIYVNDIGRCFEKCKYFLYADDTVILSVHTDLHLANINLQSEFHKFQVWAHDKQLRINLKKTKIMHIRSPLRKFSVQPRVIFHSQECIHGGVGVVDCGCSDLLQCVDEQKYLGIIIDKHFLWDAHTHYLARRLRVISCKLFHLRLFVPERILKTVYFSLFESVLSYGITSWGQASTYLIERIQRVQNSAIRNIRLGRARDADLFKELMILPVKKLYLYKTVVNNREAFRDLPRLEHCYNTRTAAGGNVTTTIYRNKHEHRANSVRLPRIFNALPRCIREEERIGRLKKDLKLWLITNEVRL